MSVTDNFNAPWRRQLREASEKLLALREENRRARDAQNPPIQASELIRPADPVRGH